MAHTGNSLGGPKNHNKYKLHFPFQGPSLLLFFFFISECSLKLDPVSGGGDWSGAGRKGKGEILMPTEETHE